MDIFNCNLVVNYPIYNFLKFFNIVNPIFVLYCGKKLYVITYKLFNIGFIFIGVYDGSERAPKLLPCSHTVCVHCLTRIAAAATNRRITQDTSSNNGRNSGNNIIQSQQQEDSQTVQRQTFRCPICRELIVVPPNGGVSALPPSFLVNQLLDLISTHRRRTLIPTCYGGGVLPSHMNQVLK